MSLELSWVGRGPDEAFLVGDHDSVLTIELKGDLAPLKMKASEQDAKPVLLVLKFVAGTREVASVELPWNLVNYQFPRLEYPVPVSKIVTCQASLAAPYDTGQHPAELLFIPKRRASFAKAFLLGSLAALATFFAALLTRLGGGVQHDLVFVWGTPIVAALVALLRGELFDASKRPPLFGVLHYPSRSLAAVALTLLAATLFVTLGTTAISNATPGKLHIRDGNEIELAPGETIVLLGRAARSEGFWTRALAEESRDNYCFPSETACAPFPYEQVFSPTFRLAPRVVVACRGLVWEGWTAGLAKGAKLTHASQQDGRVWVEPNDDCSPQKDKAQITYTTHDSSTQVEVEITAKHPYKPPPAASSAAPTTPAPPAPSSSASSTPLSSAQPVFVFEERRQARDIVTRRFFMSGTTLPLSTPGGMYSVQHLPNKAEGESGQELGTLRCAPDTKSVQRLDLVTSSLAELTFEDSAGHWLSSWTPAPSGAVTENVAFICRHSPENQPTVRALLTFASAQEPETLVFDPKLPVNELVVRYVENGRLTTIGGGACSPKSAPTKWPAWQRRPLFTPKGTLLLVENARVEQPGLETSWHRADTLPASVAIGFRSAWLCGGDGGKATMNDQHVDPGAPSQAATRVGMTSDAQKLAFTLPPKLVRTLYVSLQGGRCKSQSPIPGCNLTDDNATSFGQSAAFNQVERCPCAE